MPISLGALWAQSIIYFPWTISIPYSPSSIFKGKRFLESLPHSPFCWIIFSVYLYISLINHFIVIYSENNLLCPLLEYFNNTSFFINSIINFAAVQKCVKFFLHTWCLEFWRVNGKSWVLLELERICYRNTKHIFLLAV